MLGNDSNDNQCSNHNDYFSVISHILNFLPFYIRLMQVNNYTAALTLPPNPYPQCTHIAHRATRCWTAHYCICSHRLVLQCLRAFYEERKKGNSGLKHVANACKYSISIIAVGLSSFGNFKGDVQKAWWTGFTVLGAAYSFFWDVRNTLLLAVHCLPATLTTTHLCIFLTASDTLNLADCLL